MMIDPKKQIIMTHLLKIAFTFLFITMILSCSDKNQNPDQANNNQASDYNDLWLSYSKAATILGSGHQMQIR